MQVAFFRGRGSLKMKQYTIEELQEIIAKDYGFQKELIKNPEVCGLWHIRFEVNGIELYGSTPYAGAAPRLKVTGYTAKGQKLGIIDPEAIIEKMEGEELLWKKSQYRRN